jgi:hypothetical protein
VPAFVRRYPFVLAGSDDDADFINSMRNLEAMGRNIQEKTDSTEAGTPENIAVADVTAKSSGAITQKAKAGVKQKNERDTPKKMRKRTVSDKKLNVSADITIGWAIIL